uniref:Uncharacterized protein n=1 Tax=Anguilla anguilla TaxID=7936 RepID=A0A0E9TL82_ANGAN
MSSDRLKKTAVCLGLSPNHGCISADVTNCTAEVILS